jgi:hypothetical protein
MPFTVKTPRIFVLYAERVRLKLSVSWAPANDESGPDSNRDAPKAPPASRPTPMSRSVGAMIMPRADAKSRAVGMLRTPGSTAIRSRGIGMLRTPGGLRYGESFLFAPGLPQMVRLQHEVVLGRRFFIGNLNGGPDCVCGIFKSFRFRISSGENLQFLRIFLAS